MRASFERSLFLLKNFYGPLRIYFFPPPNLRVVSYILPYLCRAMLYVAASADWPSEPFVHSPFFLSSVALLADLFFVASCHFYNHIMLDSVPMISPVCVCVRWDMSFTRRAPGRCVQACDFLLSVESVWLGWLQSYCTSCETWNCPHPGSAIEYLLAYSSLSLRPHASQTTCPTPHVALTSRPAVVRACCPQALCAPRDLSPQAKT
jgi:hypothetical protein